MASFIVENTRRLIVALVHGQVFNEVQQLREQHAIETEQLRESEKHRAESEQSKAEAEIHRAESSNPKPKWRNSEGNSEIRRSEQREGERERERERERGDKQREVRMAGWGKGEFRPLLKHTNVRACRKQQPNL